MKGGLKETPAYHSKPHEMSPNFQDGKVYCLRVRTEGDRIVYVGSTVRPLSERMANHRRDMVRHPEWKVYKLLADVGVDNVYIELCCNFPCNNREALNAEEGRHMRIHRTAIEGGNMKVAGRTHQEYRAIWHNANREHVSAKNKEWREVNHERVALKNKEWTANNREYVAAKGKKWATENKDRMTALCKAWVESNRELVNQRYRERRAAMTPEQREAYNRRANELRIARRAAAAAPVAAVE